MNSSQNKDQAAPILRLEDINYSYRSGELEYHALSDINLTVYPGEYVAILGASGSGKSTLMNILGTLSRPTTGRMFLKETAIDSLSQDELASFRNRELGFVFQQFHLLPRLSVLNNVMLATQYIAPNTPIHAETNPAAIENHARGLLQRLGIGDQAEKLPANLSGGQKQRVAIARALLLNPSLLLADEPTGALDSKSTGEVLDIFDQLHGDGHTIVMITHDPQVAARAHRQIKISDGRIVYDSGVSSPGSAMTSTPSYTPAPLKGGRLHPLVEFWQNLRDSLYQVWQSMVAAKLRTSLTALGLMIGVMSIVVTFTLGQEAKEVILKIFAQEGTDKVYVGYDYGKARGQGLGYWRGIHLKTQMSDLEKRMAEFGKIIPLVDTWGEKPLQIAGTTSTVNLETVANAEDFRSHGLKIAKGRFFQPIELEQSSDIALIGEAFVEKYIPENYPGRWSNPQFPLGERFYIGQNIQKTVTVIGVLGHKDAMFSDRNPNEVVYLPLPSLIQQSSSPYATWFAILPNKGVVQRDAGNVLVNILKMYSNPRTPFRLEVPEEQVKNIMNFIVIFQTLTSLVGGLCIFVGGIGIMNIMLVTIAERIKEIGLKKALGATPKAVRNQFLQECSMLCLLSGSAAVILSLGFCNLIGFIAHLALPNLVDAKPIINSFAITLGLGTSVLAGFIFGMLPAARAARLDPSEALRSE